MNLQLTGTQISSGAVEKVGRRKIGVGGEQRGSEGSVRLVRLLLPDFSFVLLTGIFP